MKSILFGKGFNSTFFGNLVLTALLVLGLGEINAQTISSNDKQVYPQGICDENFTQRSDLPLTYTIRFQNKGNSPVTNVNIIDSLSSLLNRRSLKVIGASHSMVVDTTTNDNVVNFKFDNIMLPDSASNPELSQGYVIFEIGEATGNPDTARIENRSFIYFDTNAPIITNTVKNTVLNVLPLCSPPDPNPPLADCKLPTNLELEVLSDTSMRLSWDSPSDNNAVNYQILRDNQVIATIALTQNSFLDSALSSNTRYFYTIKAICGNSEDTSPAVRATTLPSVPTLLSVEAACQGRSGVIRVSSQGAVYRVYDSLNATTPIIETNNAAIETPVLSDTTTFYVAVVINDVESERLEVLVPIEEPIDAAVEQGETLETCADEFTLTAKEVENATYVWFRESSEVGRGRTYTSSFAARYQVLVIKGDCSARSEFITVSFVDAPEASIVEGTEVSFCDEGILNVDNPIANVTYEWVLNGNVLGTDNSLEVSESGTYTLKASQPSCADSTSIEVIINDSPTSVTLSADATQICENVSTVLRATQNEDYTYNWFRSGNAINNSSDTLSTTEVGTYLVEVTNPEGCKVSSNEVVISRITPPNVAISIDSLDGVATTITISAQGTIRAINWFRDGAELPDVANQTVITPIENGNFRAVVTYTSGCVFETEEVLFESSIISAIEDENDRIFRLYPNPNNGSFKLEFIESLLEDTQISVVDALGRSVYVDKLTRNEHTYTVNLPKVSAGIYIVRVFTKGKVYTKQLVIQ